MRYIKLLLSVAAVAFGVFMFVYGGYDDSPGAQLLGVLIVIAGIYGGIKGVRKNNI